LDIPAWSYVSNQMTQYGCDNYYYYNVTLGDCEPCFHNHLGYGILSWVLLSILCLFGCVVCSRQLAFPIIVTVVIAINQMICDRVWSTSVVGGLLMIEICMLFLGCCICHQECRFWKLHANIVSDYHKKLGSQRNTVVTDNSSSTTTDISDQPPIHVMTKP
jgi:hypothetical protein